MTDDEPLCHQQGRRLSLLGHRWGVLDRVLDIGTGDHSVLGDHLVLHRSTHDGLMLVSLLLREEAHDTRLH